MDYPPNAVIRLLQYGMLNEALSSSTIWVWVACNTCSMQCPMAIDIPALMDKLRHLNLIAIALLATLAIVEANLATTESDPRQLDEQALVKTMQQQAEQQHQAGVEIAAVWGSATQ